MGSNAPLRRCALAVTGALALSGCATIPAPTDQMSVATASIADAAMAGAQTYAPYELSLANDKLATARTAMAGKDHRLALRSAQQAHADAQLAVAKTQAAKAHQAADDARTTARALREEADSSARRARPGLTP